MLIAIAAAIIAIILIGVALTVIYRTNNPETPVMSEVSEFEDQGQLTFVHDEAR